MNLIKLFNRNEQIGQCLKEVEGRDEKTLMQLLGRPYQEVMAAQERLLCAAERLADQVKRMG